jgi:RHS repeat-associated protein
MQYHFPSSNNNGKIDYQVDSNLGGEQVNYAYDTLNRLITASVSNQGWSQSFAYDGFGNLDTVTGTDGFSTSYNTSTNQPTICADLNGNTLSMSTVGQTGCYSSSLYTYNVENRIAVVPGGTGAMSYSYSPGNKRVWRGSWTGSYGSFTPVTDEVTFWSVTGQKLASYQITFVQSPGYPTPPLFYVTPTGTNYYFGGKLIKNGNGNNWVYTDRLGSVGKYYPYGQDKGSSNPSSGEKFTGYFRDAETGNDYAVNRYIAPSSGRFMTPDPSGARASSPASPQSWNMYAYALGDPVNYRDPRGLEIVDGVDGDDGYDCTDDDFICISTGAGDGSAGFAADPTSSVGSKVALYNLRQMLAGLASAMLPLNEGEVGPGGPVPFYLYVASECWSPGVQGGGTLAYTLEVTYQVENQFGQPMSGAQLSGYYVAESLSNITGNVGGLSPGIWSTGPNAATPQSGTINPQGQLTDLLSAGGFPPLINLSGSSFQSFSAYGPGPVYQPLTVLGFGSPTTVLSDTYGPNNVSVNGAYFGSNPAPKCP